MKHIDIVCDGPPGPEAGRFVEVEDDTGCSIRLGEWIQRSDGYWVLRFPDLRASNADLLAALEWIAEDGASDARATECARDAIAEAKATHHS